MKLRKQNDELFKSLKNIHATIEDNHNSLLERSGKADYSINSLTETVGQHHAMLSSNRVISENQHRRIEECFHQQSQVEMRSRQEIAEKASDLKYDMQALEQKLMPIPRIVEKLHKSLDKMKADLLQSSREDMSEVTSKLKMEEARTLELEISVRKLAKLQDRVDDMTGQQIQMMQE